MTICLRERDNEKRNFGANGLGNLLKRLVKRRLALVLHSLRMRTTKRDFKAKFLKRMLRHRAEERYRHYFDRWKHCVKLINIADTVNVSLNISYLFLDRRRSRDGAQHAPKKGQGDGRTTLKNGLCPRCHLEILG